MKKFLFIILVALVNTAFAGNITEKFLIQFASNQHNLDSTALIKLEEVNTFLLQNPNAKIKLTGRTDYDGSDGYNIRLSRNRTSEVAKFLKSKGWQNAEINENWLGENKPIAQNSDENGKSLNRSVEIEITVFNFASINEWLLEQQANYKKEYKLRNSSENIITTNNETILTIPANAFVDENGKTIDNKNVKLIITEVSSSFDAIINQVFTMSGDKILETGGMYSLNIEAFNGTKSLKLATGKDINIQIPTTNMQNDMMVFEGKKDENGKIDWQSNGNPFAAKTVSDRKSIKLNENLLESLLKQIETNTPKPVVFDLNYDMPTCEVLPVKPREPNKPIKPSAKSSMSSFSYLFSTQKSRNEAIEKAYDKKMEKYEIQMKKYQKNVLAYNNLREQHKEEIEKFENDKIVFYDWVKHNLQSVKEEKEIQLEYHNKKRVIMALRKLINDSKNSTLFTENPLRSLKNSCSISKNQDKEITTLAYLNGLESCLLQLKFEQFDVIEKKYSYRKKLRVASLIKNGTNSSKNYQSKNIHNTFLDSFIMANKPIFSDVFKSEWSDYEAAFNYNNNMTERAKQDAKVENAQNYFNGNTPKLGWINCDRFMNQPVVKVNSNNIIGAMQVYVMKDIKSVITTYYDPNNNMNYVNLPSGLKFKLLTFKIENNVAYISIDEGSVSKNMLIEPKLKKMPIEEASKLMAGL